MALDIIAELEGIAATLDAAGIEYAVCGGLAVGILGLPRATKDIDVLVRRERVEEAKAAVKAIGFDIPAKRMIFRQGAPNEQEMHRLSKLDPETNDLLPVDFLVVMPIFEGVWASRLRIQYGTREISVVSREGLVTMKTMSGRPQDLADIHRLQNDDDEA
jgi:hypothetical protein